VEAQLLGVAIFTRNGARWCAFAIVRFAVSYWPPSMVVESLSVWYRASTQERTCTARESCRGARQCDVGADADPATSLGAGRGHRRA